MAFDKDKLLKSAEKYMQQGKVPAAISEYQKIVEIDPNDFNTLNTLGDLYARASQNEEAISCYSKVADNYRRNKDIVKSIAMYKKMSKLDSSNYEVCLKLAELYALQEHNVDAKHQYNIVLDAYKRDGKKKEALKVMRLIADLDPDDIHLRTELAKNYKDEGLNNDAKEIYADLGVSLLSKSRVNEAIFAFQSALAIDYAYKPAFKGLIEAFATNNEVDKAFAMLNEALGKNGQDPEYLDLLGNIYLKTKMFEQADATFNYLYQSDKNYYKKILDVAQGFLEAGQLDQVVTTIDRCLDYLLQIKEEGLATDILTNLLKQDAAHMQTLRRLGYIYMSTQKNNNLISTLKLFVQAALSQGNKPEAVMALQQLLTLEPNEEAKAQLVNLKDNEPAADDSGIARDPLLQTFNPLTTSTDAEPTAAPKVEEKKPTRGATRTSALLEGMANQSPEIIDSQISLLEEMVVSYPEYTEARVKLKNSYLQRGFKDKAAEQFLALGKIYEAQGNKELAREMLTEGYKLSMLTGGPHAAPVDKSPGSTGQFAVAQTLNRTGAFAKAPSSAPTLAGSPTVNAKGRTGSLSGAYPKTVTNNLTGTLGKLSVDISTRVLSNKLLKKEWRRACRYSRLIAVAIAKIDDFSLYLETYGEEMGETCFKRVADALTAELNRPGDELITYPGEGFVIVLPETPADGAAVVAERLKACVEALAISHAKADQWVTLSFGIASSAPARNATPDDLVEIAATAQLQAAMGGGNRVVIL